jgi:hypothetical protein
MVTISQPSKAVVGELCLKIPAGIDAGAGLTKMVIDSGVKHIRVRTPSKVLEIRQPLHDDLVSKEGGHFFYHKGSREDLEGREFLTGNLANWKAPTTHLKLSDNPALKAEYALHLLLGGLSTLSYRSVWDLSLVLSIHDAMAFRDTLKSQTQGTHFVSFGGKDKPQTKVNLNVSLVVPEGAGSYAYCVSFKPDSLIERTAHAIALDFGTSTIIPTVFAPNGAIIHRQVLEVGGCIDLLEAIATDPELIQELGQGKAGSVELIRQGIESGSFQYGTRTYNFKASYQKHVTRWLADRLRLAFKEVAEWRDAAQTLVAWGGCVELPGVSKMLATQGVTAVPDGCWANALGLQRISEARLNREVK